MIEKIQLTSILFLCISYLTISSTKADDLKLWFMAIVLVIFSTSIVLTVITTLYRILD